MTDSDPRSMDTDPPVRDVPKIPSMWHLPSSREHAREQDFISESELERSRLADEPVILTEKLDGSNVRLTRQAVFSRSNKDPDHDSFDRLKARHAEFGHLIPEDVVVYGEWVYAKHSIHYTELTDYLYVFGAFDTNEQVWLSWPSTQEIAAEMGINTVPVLQRVEAGLGSLDSLPEPAGTSAFGSTREGYVARLVDAFPHEDFKRAVGKSVRENHVQTDEHWKFQPITPNELAEK